MSDLEIEKATEPKIKNLEEGEVPDEEDYQDSSDKKIIIVVTAIIIGLFLVTIGGFSLYNNLTTAGVINIDDLHQDNLNNQLKDEEGYIYNGFSFVKVDGLWWTEMNKFGVLLKVPLHFAPKDLEDIPLEGKLNLDFNIGEDVYIAIDPYTINKYYSLAISELSLNLVKGMDRIPVGSCTEESPDCVGREIINCENPRGFPVVELAFEPNLEPRIEFKDTCVKIIGGDNYGIVKAVDRLLYEWYGVMSRSN